MASPSYEHATSVRTLARWQVLSQPAYCLSVERWRCDGASLAPLIKVLSDLAPVDGPVGEHADRPPGQQGRT